VATGSKEAFINFLVVIGICLFISRPQLLDRYLFLRIAVDLLLLGFLIHVIRRHFSKKKGRELEKAREKFYTAIEKVDRGEYDDNMLIPGATGELVGSSQKSEILKEESDDRD